MPHFWHIPIPLGSFVMPQLDLIDPLFLPKKISFSDPLFLQKKNQLLSIACLAITFHDWAISGKICFDMNIEWTRMTIPVVILKPYHQSSDITVHRCGSLQLEVNVLAFN